MNRRAHFALVPEDYRDAFAVMHTKDGIQFGTRMEKMK